MDVVQREGDCGTARLGSVLYVLAASVARARVSTMLTADLRMFICELGFGCGFMQRPAGVTTSSMLQLPGKQPFLHSATRSRPHGLYWYSSKALLVLLGPVDAVEMRSDTVFFCS